MSSLKELQQLLDSHLAHDEVRPLGQIGVFHCRQHQTLHAVPIHHPSLVLVLKGTKRVAFSTRDERLQCGELALLPAGAELLMENIPCPRNQEYLALCLSIAPDTVDRFLGNYGAQLDWTQQQNRLIATAPEDLVRVLKQRVAWCMEGDLDNWIFNDLQQQEVLSICGQHHLLGLMLQSRSPSWVQRVSALVSLDLSHKWKIADVCRKLGVSESSLRRSLQEEGTGFSDILEQARLVAALSVMQETDLSIAEVSAMVGYQSQSRFTERFKLRFGMTPSQLKQSRQVVDEKGESLKESG